MNPQSEPNGALVSAQAVPEGTRAITKFTAEHGREIGIPSPEAINYMKSIANLLVNTALIGKDMGLHSDQILKLRQMGMKPEDIEVREQEAITANAIAKMLVGREFPLEIPPMAALQELSIVKGKIFTHYSTLQAQMEFKGIKFKTIERSHERAAWEVTRPGREPEEFEFTVEDAKMAGLIRRSRDGELLQYELRPRVMLWARLVSETYRATGGRANVYTHEERREVLHDDEPSNDRPAEPLADPDPNPFKVTAAPKEPAPQEHKTEPEVHVEPEVKVQSGAPEPAKTEKRRGRPPKAAEQTPEQALAEQKAKQASAPAEPPTSDFKASDEDLPGEIGAESKPEPAKAGPQLVAKPELGQSERIQAVDALLAKELKRDPEACRKQVRQWLASFLNVGGVGKLPQPGSSTRGTPPNPAYDGAIPVLESMAAQYAQAIVGDPSASGTQAGAGWGKFVRTIDGWPEDVKELSKTVAIQRHPDSADDLLAFLFDVANLSEPNREMWTFLQIYRISRSTPMKLLEASAVQKTTMEAIAGRVRGDLTEQAVLSAIAGVQTGAQEETLWQE